MARRPWWILPILGPIPQGVDEQHLRLLGFIAFAMLFENYDLGLLSAALPQIGGDFGLTNPEKGAFMGKIELGGLAAFLIVPFGDWIGRRRVLLACVVGMSLGSALTAFATSPNEFIACQVLTRSFASSATVVSFVIVAEEFPADHRGWGIGMLAAVGAVGFGLGAAFYSQVEKLPYGWRSLYLMGGLAIFLLPFFRRRIRETRRFLGSAAAGTRDGILSMLGPVIALARRYPRRALLFGMAALLSTAGHRPAFRFVSDFLQTDYGWSPKNYATLMICGGLLGIVGSPLAGRLGDRFGRRQICAAMLLPFPLVAWGFFVEAGSTAALVPVWIAMVFVSMAAGVILRTLSTELFPTEMRSSAGGWYLLVEILGATFGLFLFAGIDERIDAWGVSLTAVAGVAALGSLFLLFLPDTHRRELETIADEADAAR